MEGKETSDNDGLDIEFDIASIEDTVEAPEKIEETEETKETVETTEAKEDLKDIDKPETLEASEPEPTVEEPITEEAKEEDSSVVSEIISKLGYEIDGDFEDSTEGIVELTKNVSEKMAEETLDSIFNAHPSVKRHLDFVMNGGNANQFIDSQKETDYESVEVREDDKESQKKILTDYFVARGDDKAFIGDMIEAYEDKNALFQKANQAKEALAGAQKQKQDRMLEEQRSFAEKQREESEQVWNNVKETVKSSSNLSGLPISERDKSKFISYISDPVTKDGRTQRDLDTEKMSLDQKLAADYFLYKKDFAKFINTKGKTEAAKSLKNRLKSNSTGKVKGGKSNPNYKGGGNSQFDDLDVGGLF